MQGMMWGLLAGGGCCSAVGCCDCCFSWCGAGIDGKREEGQGTEVTPAGGDLNLEPARRSWRAQRKKGDVAFSDCDAFPTLYS